MSHRLQTMGYGLFWSAVERRDQPAGAETGEEVSDLCGVNGPSVAGRGGVPLSEHRGRGIWERVAGS